MIFAVKVHAIKAKKRRFPRILEAILETALLALHIRRVCIFAL
jgi:hypothetical protein